MARIVKDPVRQAIVKAYPPAPKGMKKAYTETTRTVKYIPKTPNEIMRERLRKTRP
jgi:hypothetical protein